MSLGNFKAKVKYLLLPSSRRLKIVPDDWSDSKITLYDMPPSPQASFDKPVVVIHNVPPPLHIAKRSTKSPTFSVHFPNNLKLSNLNKTTTEKRKSSGMFASVSRFGSGIMTRGVIKRRKSHVPPTSPSLHREPASPEFLTADARRRRSQTTPSERSLSRTFNLTGNALSYIKVPCIPGVSSLLL
jgi:hypothetical protein